MYIHMLHVHTHVTDTASILHGHPLTKEETWMKCSNYVKIPVVQFESNVYF